MSRIVGIEIGAREFRIAVAQQGFGRPRLQQLLRVPHTEIDRLSAITRHAKVVRVSVPLRLATHRMLSLPFRGARQLAATVPLELLGQLPTEPHDAIIGWRQLGHSPAGATVLAAVIRAATLTQWINPVARVQGLPAETILDGGPILATLPTALKNAAVVVADGTHSYVAVCTAGVLTGLRALDGDATNLEASFVSEIDRTLQALAATSTPVVLAGSDASPELARRLGTTTSRTVTGIAALGGALAGFPADDVAACAGAAGLVLGDASTRLRFPTPDDRALSRPHRRIAPLAAAAALLALVDLGLFQRRLVREEAALQQAIHAVAATALPTIDPREEPRLQLETALRLQHAHGPGAGAPAIELLRDARSRLPNEVALQVDELVLDRDLFRLHGRTDSYEHVDNLRRALEASPLLADVQTTDTHGSVDGQAVEFTLQASRRAVAETAS